MRALALVRVDDTGADLLVLAGDGAAVHQALDRVLFPADRVKLGAVEAATLVRWMGAAAPEGSHANLLAPGVDLGAGANQPAWLQTHGEALPAWLEALPEFDPEAAERQRIRQGFPAAPGELNDSTNPFELGLAPVGEPQQRLLCGPGNPGQARHLRRCETAVALLALQPHRRASPREPPSPQRGASGPV